MAKYKKKNVYNSRKRLIPPRKIFRLSKQKRRKESRWKLLSSLVKQRVRLDPWSAEKLILFPVSSGQRTGIFSVGRRAKHIKISCLPRGSSLNRSSHRWNYLNRQIKKIAVSPRSLLKTQASLIYHLLALWKFTSAHNRRRAFPSFIHHKYMEITYFCFKKAYPP